MSITVLGITHHQFAVDTIVFLLAATFFGFLVMVVPRRDERRVAFVAVVATSVAMWSALGWLVTFA